MRGTQVLDSLAGTRQEVPDTDVTGPSRLVRDVLALSRQPRAVEEPLVDLRSRLHYEDAQTKELKYQQGLVMTTYYDSSVQSRVHGSRAPQMPTNLLAIIFDKFACIQEGLTKPKP